MEAAANKSEKAGGEEDLSMEEILQSIRKIIAEDDNEGKKPVAEDAKGKEVPGSDVLELTDMVAEGNPAPAKAEATDVLSAIDQAVPPPPKPTEAPKAAAPAPAASPAPAAPAPAAAAPPPAATKSSQDEIDSLLSAGAASTATENLKKLQAVEPPLPPLKTTPGPVFYSGETVEGMVINMLKPMMKEWLDANLPQVVERIVEREVRKLTKYLTDKDA